MVVYPRGSSGGRASGSAGRSVPPIGPGSRGGKGSRAGGGDRIDLDRPVVLNADGSERPKTGPGSRGEPEFFFI